ncbi:MAG: hypothetical protein AAF439_04690 [Pseudomonadota bacterium]
MSDHLKDLRRVMVVGGSGAGKSTFAAALAARLGVPAVHMDTLFWRPGWVEAPEEEFLASVQAAAAGDAWVMDGNYSRTWPGRLGRADAVVFLDMPTWLRFWRAVRRTMKNYGKTRADLGTDCPERLDLGFLFGWVVRYRWQGRHKALGLMADDGPAAGLRRFHLTSPRQVRRFLDGDADIGSGP